MEQVETHLKEALAHLKEAISLSAAAVVADSGAKRAIGAKWESFLSDFFRFIREKSQETRMNLLSFVKFPR